MGASGLQGMAVCLVPTPVMDLQGTGREERRQAVRAP
jgi:hypothetical protein